MKVAIFNNPENGAVSVISAPIGASINEAANSAVPEGVEFWVVESSTVPNAPRESWVIIDGELSYDEVLAASINAESSLVIAKEARDLALSELVHDFGDGRVMQVRPSDEQVVTNAIKLMTISGEDSIEWVMLDDKKYPVTITELQEASVTGLVGAAQIWSSYDPEA